MNEFNQEAYLACYSECTNPTIFQFAVTQLKDKLLEDRKLKTNFVYKQVFCCFCSLKDASKTGMERRTWDHGHHGSEVSKGAWSFYTYNSKASFAEVVQNDSFRPSGNSPGCPTKMVEWSSQKCLRQKKWRAVWQFFHVFPPSIRDM